MKRFLIISILLATCAITLVAHAKKKNDCEFVILITSYKNEQYVEENLRSACWQNSSNPYQIIYVDDCSPDGTVQKVEEYISKHKLTNVTFIKNKERVGSLANHYIPIHSLVEDHKIILSLDGDDTLADNNVLTLLESYYEDPNVWMTYGSALGTHGNKRISFNIPDSVFLKKRIRRYKWCPHHLKTFRASLFKKIKKNDLFYKGEFMRVTGDMAMMFPMLEMCAPKKKGDKNRSCHIDDILYIYQMGNPINNYKVRKNIQNEVGSFIRCKESYEPLDNLE